MSADWPWSELGLDGPVDARAVKRAYAKKLKTIDRNDPEAFQTLRDAFGYAKDIAPDAAPAAARKPSVAELMGAATPAPPLPDVRDIPDVPMPAEDIAPSDTASPDPILADTAESDAEGPDNLQEPEEVEEDDFDTYIPPPPPKPLLWSDKIEDLPNLFESDPAKAEQKYWQHHQKALSNWPIDTAILTSLLNMPFADRDKRNTTEWEIYAAISRHLEQSQSIVLPRELSELLEEKFSWASDGVALSRRLGWRRDFHEVLYWFSLGLPDSAQPRVHKVKVPKKTKMFLYYKGGVFGLFWLLTLTTQRVSGGADLLVHFVALAILFGMVHFALSYIYPILWKVLTLMRADRLLRAVFPVTIDSLESSEEERGLFQFILSAGALGLVFLMGG